MAAAPALAIPLAAPPAIAAADLAAALRDGAVLVDVRPGMAMPQEAYRRGNAGRYGRGCPTWTLAGGCVGHPAGIGRRRGRPGRARAGWYGHHAWVRLNMDGPGAWRAAGLPMAAGDDVPADKDFIDYLFFVHDRQRRQQGRSAAVPGLGDQSDPPDRRTGAVDFPFSGPSGPGLNALPVIEIRRQPPRGNNDEDHSYLFAAAATLGAAVAHADVLDDVKARGKLICGTQSASAPVPYQDTATRSFVGCDVDMCAALAKGLGVALEHKPLSTGARIPGELKMNRVATWSPVRWPTCRSARSGGLQPAVPARQHQGAGAQGVRESPR